MLQQQQKKQNDAVQSPKQNARRRAETWRALVALKQQGTLAAIGVSNYTPRHARELLRACAASGLQVK
jgi:diketogulonate reductase-like aldo/keto reductase